jgi:tetratricopeptide (TPR) repeat protein
MRCLGIAFFLSFISDLFKGNFVTRDLERINEAELLLLAQPTNVIQCKFLATLYNEVQSWRTISPRFKYESKEKALLANAFYNAAYVTKGNGHYLEAIELYFFSLDFCISQPEEVYVNLAVIYSENLRIEDKAIAMLLQALKLKNDFLPALYNLAGLHEEMGEKELAIDIYRRILTLAPLDIDVLVRLSACLTRKESGQLIVPIKQALALPNLVLEDKINLYYALGKVLDDNQDYALAFKSYQEANSLEASSSNKYVPVNQERFIDENMELFDRSWFDKLPVISNAKPVFICGMFRSGSTLLEQIISAHSEITAGGEIDFFDSCISPLGYDYPKVIERYSVDKLHDIANSYLKKINQLFPDTNILTDKRPDNFLYIGLIKTIFPNAIIIQTERNLKDNCLAIYFQRLHRKLTYATDLKNIKHYYLQQQRLMSHWKKLFPNSFHVVDYARLVSAPKESTKGIFKSLGLQWQEESLTFFLNDNSVKTASIWQVRQPLHSRSCERWKNYEVELRGVVN